MLEGSRTSWSLLTRSPEVSYWGARQRRNYDMWHFKVQELVWIYNTRGRRLGDSSWTVGGLDLARSSRDWVRLCTLSICHWQEEKSHCTETGWPLLGHGQDQRVGHQGDPRHCPGTNSALSPPHSVKTLLCSAKVKRTVRRVIHLIYLWQWFVWDMCPMLAQRSHCKSDWLVFLALATVQLQACVLLSQQKQLQGYCSITKLKLRKTSYLSLYVRKLRCTFHFLFQRRGKVNFTHRHCSHDIFFLI